MIAFLCIDLLTLEESDPYKKREETYRATNNHGRRSIVVTQVKRELHARVATTNNNYFLPLEAFSRLVLTGMDNITFEFTKPFNLRDHALRILAVMGTISSSQLLLKNLQSHNLRHKE